MDLQSRTRTDLQERDDDSASADVIIVGGGAAGLSAALTLARAGWSAIVIDAGLPRNRFAEHVHGFLSRDGMPPDELLAAGRAEVEGYGGTIMTGKVIAATVNDEGTRVTVTLDDGARLEGRRLLVATGLRDEQPQIEGVAARWGIDVLHCPYCHGYEVRGQPIGVIATGSLSTHQAHLIRQWSPDVVLFLNGHDVPDASQLDRLTARDIRLVEGTVRRLIIDEARDRLTGIEIDDGSIIERTAVFVGPQMSANDSLLIALGATIDRHEFASWVVTDKFGLTSVPGVWAAGNVADPMGQVIHAAGGGVFAAGGINMSLIEEDIQRAVANASAKTSEIT